MGINNIHHAGSIIIGLTGPISWTEIYNFNYFTPGQWNAYFTTSGTLTVATVGTNAVTNYRYADARALAGYTH